jgi:hypothetical protein
VYRTVKVPDRKRDTNTALGNIPPPLLRQAVQAQIAIDEFPSQQKFSAFYLLSIGNDSSSPDSGRHARYFSFVSLISKAYFSLNSKIFKCKFLLAQFTSFIKNA